MQIEFDDDKDRINRAKHGLPLAAGYFVLANSVHSTIDDRLDYGEERRIDYGVVNGRLMVCVHTVRSGVHRIISVRKANRREQRRWLR
ncbi:MAG: BrnT family toxin [Dongiaceae bacterium]